MFCNFTKKIRNYICGPPTVDCTVKYFAEALEILREVEERESAKINSKHNHKEAIRSMREVERARGVSFKIHELLCSDLF